MKGVSKGHDPMADPEKEVFRKIEQHGYELIRSKKHLIYRNPITGQQLTLPKTPSDLNSWNSILSTLDNQIHGVRAERPRPFLSKERPAVDKLLRTQQPRMPVARRSRKRSKGTGIAFKGKLIQALSAEEKAASRAASLAAKTKEENDRNRRRVEREFVAQCVRHVLHETEQVIAWHRRKHEYIIENFRRAWKLLQGLGSPDFDRKRAGMTVQDRGTVDFVILALGRFSQTQRVSERDAMAIVIVSMRFYARKYIHYRRVAEARARQYANGWIAGEPLELNKMKQEITSGRDPFGELFADSLLDGIASWHRGMAIVRAEAKGGSNVLLPAVAKAA